MEYSKARPYIKSGDLLAWSGGSWKNLHDIEVNIVRIFTMSEYSHIGVAWVTGGRVLVVEAVVPYIRIYPLSKSYMPFYWFPLNLTWSNEAEERLLSRVGEPYSKWEAIKAFFRKNNDDNHEWECVEQAIDTLSIIDSRFNYVQATPTKIVEFIQEKYNAPSNMITKI